MAFHGFLHGCFKYPETAACALCGRRVQTGADEVSWYSHKTEEAVMLNFPVCHLMPCDGEPRSLIFEAANKQNERRVVTEALEKIAMKMLWEVELRRSADSTRRELDHVDFNEAQHIHASDSEPS